MTVEGSLALSETSSDHQRAETSSDHQHREGTMSKNGTSSSSFDFTSTDNLLLNVLSPSSKLTLDLAKVEPKYTNQVNPISDINFN